MKPRVFVTGSLWSLLIYLIVNTLDDIKRTHYFFADKGIPQEVRKQFKHHVINIRWDDKINWRLTQFCYIFIPFFNVIRWPFLLFSDIWGIDQGFGIQSIIGRRSYTLVEDGAVNYCTQDMTNTGRHKLIRKLLWGDIYLNDIGRNSKCRKIILTQPSNDSKLKDKTVIVDIPSLWNKSSDEKKSYILSRFNISSEDIKSLSSKKTILLTQPFSLDCGLSEEEQISMYRHIIRPYGEENVVIKPHPREKIDYASYFPKSLIFDKAVPFQLFGLLNIVFETVVTVSSTSAMSIKSDSTNVDFKGTTIDKRISDVYGIITKETLLK